MDRKMKEEKGLVWSCVSFKFLFLLKVKPIQPLLSNDSHNKRPLIDSYPTLRAVNGLSLPVCPLFICVESIGLSLHDRLFTVCVSECDTLKHRGVSVY